MTTRSLRFPRQKYHPNAFRSVSSERVSSSDDSDSSTASERQWNLKALKQDISKRHQRVFKKVQKAHEKLDKASSDTETDRADSVDIIEKSLQELKSQLSTLSLLDEDLKTVKSTSDIKFLHLVPTLMQMDLKDQEVPKKKKVEVAPKTKGPKPLAGPRLPYYRYESADGIEIRVGRGADDNDELSCNPEHRRSNEWWMHVAGHPGSHVVICSSDDDLRQTHKQTVLDAALLTVIHSKASQSGNVEVTLTRCRNVSKPAGAKAGLVQLSGDMYKVKVNVRAESLRRDRLKRL